MSKLKMKSHSGTKKRIRITKNGKLVRSRANSVHFNEKKSEGRKRVIATKAIVKGSIGRNLKRALGV